MRRRIIEDIKETLALGAMFIGVPMLMIIHWLIIGY